MERHEKSGAELLIPNLIGVKQARQMQIRMLIVRGQLDRMRRARSLAIEIVSERNQLMGGHKRFAHNQTNHSI